jgi:hypothetical protein
MKRVIDIATAPIEHPERFIDTPKPRKGTIDEAKQSKQIADKLAERIDGAGLDLDLCRLSAVGWITKGPTTGDIHEPLIVLCPTETEEIDVLKDIAFFFGAVDNQAITYFGLNFDLLVLQRRALYLGVPFPKLNTDRYRSPHPDIGELLSGGNPDRRRPLTFYVKRLGWDDLQKPLAGADEAKVHESGQWDLLAESVRHDVLATARLASWLKVW